jgi:hypothetical protein
MKTLYNSLKIAAGTLILSALVVSCLPEQQTMGDAGQTLLKLNPTGFTVAAFDAKSAAQSGVLFEVRRDVNSQAALNSSTSVVLTYDSDGTILDDYNTENETELIPLPANLGTTTPAMTGGKITLDFGPGEFSKAVLINIPNATLFDFSKQYALAYTLTEVASGTGALSEGADKVVIAQVLVKNKFDGKYEVTAVTPMLDVANAAFTTYEPFMYHLETTGSSSCICIDYTVWYDAMHPMKNAGATSGYGSFGLELTFADDGKITGVKNPWGNPPANTRMPVLDPSGVNAWDPATKNIRIKYWMIQPSVVTTAPYIRVYFDEKWTYKGQR